VTVRFAVSIPQLVTDSTLHHEADAGAGLIVLNPRFDDHEQMERLSADVIPQVSWSTTAKQCQVPMVARGAPRRRRCWPSRRGSRPRSPVPPGVPRYRRGGQ